MILSPARICCKVVHWVRQLTTSLRHPPQQTLPQFIESLRQAQQHHLFSYDTLGMIEGVLRVTTMQVRDIMIPRAEMIMLPDMAHPADILPLITQSGHSRFPVLDQHSRQVVGILLAKDLLKIHLSATRDTLELRTLIRPATIIPESKRLNHLLNDFRLKRHHMAIVVDEYGQTVGLVTIEDVLEQIVGDIVDEHDARQQEAFIQQLSNLEYKVQARTPLHEFNEYFNTDYPHKDFDTFGGLMLHQFSHLPQQGEQIIFDDFEVTVLEAKKRSIQLLKVTRRIERPHGRVPGNASE